MGGRLYGGFDCISSNNLSIKYLIIKPSEVLQRAVW